MMLEIIVWQLGSSQDVLSSVDIHQTSYLEEGDEETEGKSASYLQYHNSFGVGGVKHRTGRKEPDRLTEIRLFLAVESLPETNTTKTRQKLSVSLSGISLSGNRQKVLHLPRGYMK
ncbi:hypothetical protein CDAR_102681 [Caerostris darwini]|uniref:Uncharacterized protein n=1 Tax=Caerostris darwini TaxID=1538125 RepID=A0AAV4WPB3_9ARAC|nr:hypothetical protein CDAR_102681 [Caerostris darwini]